MQGLHPTPAAALLGVPDSTLSQWRKDRPEFEDAIKRAEAEHMQSRLQQVGSAINIEEKDARTLRWFLERRFPEQFGAKAASVTVNTNVNAPVVLSASQLEALQARRRSALQKSNPAAK